LDGGQGLLHPVIVTYQTVFYRHIVVGTQKYALASQIGFADGLFIKQAHLFAFELIICIQVWQNGQLITIAVTTKIPDLGGRAL
jgi:hypothetical protein